MDLPAGLCVFLELGCSRVKTDVEKYRLSILEFVWLTISSTNWVLRQYGHKWAPENAFRTPDIWLFLYQGFKDHWTCCLLEDRKKINSIRYWITFCSFTLFFIDAHYVSFTLHQMLYWYHIRCNNWACLLVSFYSDFTKNNNTKLFLSYVLLNGGSKNVTDGE